MCVCEREGEREREWRERLGGWVGERERGRERERERWMDVLLSSAQCRLYFLFQYFNVANCLLF